eukprot:794404-Rhodomonas_salina.1
MTLQDLRIGSSKDGQLPLSFYRYSLLLWYWFKDDSELSPPDAGGSCEQENNACRAKIMT